MGGFGEVKEKKEKKEKKQKKEEKERKRKQAEAGFGDTAGDRRRQRCSSDEMAEAPAPFCASWKPAELQVSELPECIRKIRQEQMSGQTNGGPAAPGGGMSLLDRLRSQPAGAAAKPPGCAPNGTGPAAAAAGAAGEACPHDAMRPIVSQDGQGRRCAKCGAEGLEQRREGFRNCVACGTDLCLPCWREHEAERRKRKAAQQAEEEERRKRAEREERKRRRAEQRAAAAAVNEAAAAAAPAPEQPPGEPLSKMPTAECAPGLRVWTYGGEESRLGEQVVGTWRLPLKSGAPKLVDGKEVVRPLQPRPGLHIAWPAGDAGSSGTDLKQGRVKSKYQGSEQGMWVVEEDGSGRTCMLSINDMMPRVMTRDRRTGRLLRVDGSAVQAGLPEFAAAGLPTPWAVVLDAGGEEVITADQLWPMMEDAEA